MNFDSPVFALFDRNQARIAGAVIRIENGDLKRRLRSDYEGKFELELPAGTYDIRVEQPGFKPLTLSSISVNEGVIERLHLVLEDASSKEPLKVQPVGNPQIFQDGTKPVLICSLRQLVVN